MAARFEGIEYTVTGSAATLTSALGLSSQLFFSHAAFRAGDSNAGTVYMGKSDVTTGANRLVYIRTGEAFTIDLAGQFTSTDQYYIIGTPGDVLHISMVL